MADKEIVDEGREKFSSRLGFILISAGCAIGLGNIWRFPYITGEYGGAAFVLLILFFLVVLGVPLLVMEFAMGRASYRSLARSYEALEPQGSKWHRFKWLGLVGCYLLMMFYTVVCGWTIAYFVKAAMGTFDGTEDVSMVFGSMLGNPMELTGWMLLVAVIGFGVCAMGLQKGVERITKVMMAALFVVMALLCLHSLTLEGGQAGLEFYLLPNFDNLFNNPNASFPQIVYAAMSQAMFMLSIGVGSMSIFGSYVKRDRKLTGEAVNVALLDALVAIMAGLIIFPACVAYGINPDAGPGLVFLTLPTVFEQMPLGQLWCTLFFLFVAAAALSSVIAVFEAILRFTMDQWDITRKRAVAINAPILALLSLPCVFGYNIWADFMVPGIGDVQSLEDFILSNNILPIGCLLFVLFCTTKRGWGWDKFMAEADRGEGISFPKWSRLWVKYGVPALILIVFFTGWAPTMQTWLGLA
ncbi:MAG: sodium-dependent transporter [Eggerthellaceae bacterium]|nr:sodium-dependent transporter [Eggerthellaceae bacterium]